jgi:hypothetical protein
MSGIHGSIGDLLVKGLDLALDGIQKLVPMLCEGSRARNGDDGV